MRKMRGVEGEEDLTMCEPLGKTMSKKMAWSLLKPGASLALLFLAGGEAKEPPKGVPWPLGTGNPGAPFMHHPSEVGVPH